MPTINAESVKAVRYSGATLFLCEMKKMNAAPIEIYATKNVKLTIIGKMPTWSAAINSVEKPNTAEPKIVDNIFNLLLVFTVDLENSFDKQKKAHLSCVNNPLKNK